VYLEIPRDVLDREVEVSKAIVPKPVTNAPRPARSAIPRHQKLADLLVNSERPAILYGQQVWTAAAMRAIALLRALDIPGYFNAAAAVCCRRRSAHFDRTRGTLSPTPTHPHRRHAFDFRMATGGASAPAQAGADRHGLSHVGKNRDIDLDWSATRAPSGGGVAGGLRPSQAGQAPGAPAMDEKADRRRSGGYREADALFKSTHPDPPYRVAYELNEFLAETPSTSATRRRRDDLRPGSAPSPAGSVDGSWSARIVGLAPASRLRQGSPIRARKCCATTVTARSA